MRFGIVGYGVVGRHLGADVLRAGQPLVIYDKFDARYDNTQAAVNGCDLVFVCVSTPPGLDGRCDVSAVDDVFTWLRAPLAVIRSTVAVGTTDRLQAQTGGRAVVFCPEFIGEGVNAPYNHMAQPPFLVLGGAPFATHAAAQALGYLYNAECRLFTTDARTAECIKYAENAFLATKVTFFNEWFDICRALGANWQDFVGGLTLDYRIGASHTQVHEDDRGWGGRCLPKDTAALLAHVGPETAPLLAAVRAVNDAHRRQP
jgi:UDPglucose 6-dehydrogenase